MYIYKNLWCHLGKIAKFQQKSQLPNITRQVNGTLTSEVTPLTVWYTSPWSLKGHGHGHEWPSHTPFVQCHFWLRYSKFRIWPWKFKVMVMAEVKPNGHIWGLEFNWYICFSLHGNRTIFGWDRVISIFDLTSSRSRSWPRSNPMVTFEA